MNGQATNIRYHIDRPESWARQSRCIVILGWCFSVDGQPVRAVRLKAGEHAFFGVVGRHRPDVRAALPEAPDDNTGFEIQGVLPSGRSELSLEVRLTDENWIQILHCVVKAKRQLLPFWMGCGSWVELMLLQTPVYMTHAPRNLQCEKFPAPRRNLRRPKFAIVTPSYQQAQFLEKTMRCVLEQRGADCQYVVQDGGSTDGSAALIERFAGEQKALNLDGDERKPDGNSSTLAPCSILSAPGSPRLVAWDSAPDAGQADAIVKGFAKTSGDPDDLMAWINSDDFYLPDALAFVADYFARHPEVDAIYGHRIVVNENSQEIARWFLPKHDDEILRLNDFVPQETMFWRRRIWDKTGGLDSSFKFAMDWDLLLRFQAAGAHIVRVPYFLACFRVHQAQKTTALMNDIGQREITALRERTHGRSFPPQALEDNPQIIRYLRRSAFVQFMWKLGVRLP